MWGELKIGFCRSIAPFAFVVILLFPLIDCASAKSRFDSSYFSNATVVDHNGNSLQFFDDLIKGKVVIINFIYLTCNDICPLTTSRMAELVTRLGPAVGRDVQIYSITMDPARDRPADLKAYADAFAAPEGWLFLTGDVEQIKTIRWRLGERSRTLSEHRNDVVLGNDLTGEWSRSSIYADIELLARNVNDLAGLETSEQRQQRVGRSDPAAPENRNRYRFDRPQGEALFNKACSTCHSIGEGDRIGPDLIDIESRRTRNWLERFISNPRAMRASGDSQAVAVSEKYKGVIMPDLGLEKIDIIDVLSYIELRSAARSAQKEQQDNQTKSIAR